MHRFFFFVFLLLTGTLVQANDQPQILTSIKPLQLIVQAIAGEHAQVQTLLPPGASPHAFSLRPSDSKRFAQADIFYWVGPDMENFLLPLVKRRSQHSVALQQLPTLQLLHYADDAHNEMHDHHHLPGGIDTHLWLSVHNARAIARQIAIDLARIDAQHTQTYQTNLAVFEQQLDKLDEELKALFEPVRDKRFFVFHEAFNYLEHEYNLLHNGVFAMSNEIQPGARHVQQMRQNLEQAGPSCIFTEPPAPPRLAYSLSKGLPVKLQALDPLGATASNYPELLRAIAQHMHDCLDSL